MVLDMQKGATSSRDDLPSEAQIRSQYYAESSASHRDLRQLAARERMKALKIGGKLRFTEDALKWRAIRERPGGFLWGILRQHPGVLDEACQISGFGSDWSSLMMRVLERFHSCVPHACALEEEIRVGTKPVTACTDATVELAIVAVVSGLGLRGGVDLWAYGLKRRRNVRRAWLGLSVLGRFGQRPGGYTSVDMGDLSGVRSRPARRKVVSALLDLGILMERRTPGKQPRYVYGGRLAKEWRRRETDIWLSEAVNEVTRTAQEALRDPAKTHWPYALGEPQPPEWLLDAYALALRLVPCIIELGTVHPSLDRLPREGWTGYHVLRELERRAWADPLVATPLNALAFLHREADPEEWAKWWQACAVAGRGPVSLLSLEEMLAPPRPLLHRQRKAETADDLASRD